MDVQYCMLACHMSGFPILFFSRLLTDDMTAVQLGVQAGT